MGKIRIARPAFRATIVSVVSMAVSFVIAAVVIGKPGGAFEGPALILCIACPLLIAWPASFHANLQRARLAALMAELRAAHTHLAATHLRLAEKAKRDDMTGFLNRDAFLASIEDARRRTDDGTLLFIDVDHFKRTNDDHGHLAGDEALKLICSSIGRAVRGTDILGRIGGEEFGAFIVGADDGEAARVAERIRGEVEKLDFRVDGEKVPLTVSIGAALHRPGTLLTELMREADRRLYKAKGLGRNRVMFSDKISTAA